MCNDFGNRVPYSAYVEEISHLRIPVRFPEAAPNLDPCDDIWPTETAPDVHQTVDGNEFVEMRGVFDAAAQSYAGSQLSAHASLLQGSTSIVVNPGGSGRTIPVAD